MLQYFISPGIKLTNLPKFIFIVKCKVLLCFYIVVLSAVDNMFNIGLIFTRSHLVHHKLDFEVEGLYSRSDICTGTGFGEEMGISIASILRLHRPGKVFDSVWREGMWKISDLTLLSEKSLSLTIKRKQTQNSLWLVNFVCLTFSQGSLKKYFFGGKVTL